MADNFSRSKKQTRMSFLHQNRAANVPYVPVNFLKVSVAVIFLRTQKCMPFNFSVLRSSWSRNVGPSQDELDVDSTKIIRHGDHLPLF